KFVKDLKKRFGRPLINTEWLARIRGCDVQDCYPYFAQERIGCTCWGFVAGKYQTYEPWEGMWKQVEKGYRGFQMTKWFHDLYRPSLRPYDPEEIDIIKHVNAQMDAELKGESLRAKIAKKRKIERQDMWHGYRRTQFEFNGRKAWVVEPSIAPRKDAAWIWNMLWPDYNVERMQAVELLKRGFHYAYIDLFDTRMDEAGVAAAAEFQSFLVKELGFAPKANLIGISWGGFMAAQYAAAKPANVAKIYFDNALLTFDGYTPPAKVGLGPWEDATKRVPPCWRDDPRMPVNCAGGIAKAGIRVLLVYGTSDIAVKPSANSKAFLAKFKAAGGNATVLEHPEYGHHPHGVESGEAKVVLDFFRPEERRL
ncbi:MAG: alpha/beta fold hydrolase, partial [Kiritimatiellae bacterium]|nr:alpha/beta fold hydrolase [Kiritimatiellia bacterium]